jgi:hypothetical protein
MYLGFFLDFFGGLDFFVVLETNIVSMLLNKKEWLSKSLFKPLLTMSGSKSWEIKISCF